MTKSYSFATNQPCLFTPADRPDVLINIANSDDARHGLSTLSVSRSDSGRRRRHGAKEIAPYFAENLSRLRKIANVVEKYID
jgi:hypothetical protein